LVLVISAIPLAMRAGTIILGGAGSSVEEYGIDDKNFASTLDATYLGDVAPATLALLSGFGNFAVAGAPGVAQGILPLLPSNFSLAVYHPWVVDNHPGVNDMIAPDGSDKNRQVYHQDAGGADYFLYYTPLFPSDPTAINFIQVFQENTNDAGFGPTKLDNFGSPTSPYYNQPGHAAGVGATTGVSPLVIPPGAAAWMMDIPYRCENGPPPYFNNPNCQVGPDDSLLSQVQTFQDFIEADTDIGGATYKVLYGGVQWGYDYHNQDAPVPEPSTFLAAAAGLAAIVVKLRRRCNNRAFAWQAPPPVS
jgi:hypothetical protein